MSKVTLPKLNQTGANLWSTVEANDVALREVINGGLDNENIAVGANIARSKLEGGAQGIAGQWYTPKIIATEESRENVAFGKLTTPDEIAGIVVPENGILRIGYRAHVSSAVSGEGRVAIFVSSNQLKTLSGVVIEQIATGTGFGIMRTEGGGLIYTAAIAAADVTTGQVLGIPVDVFLAAGTYTVSIQFKAGIGQVVAKERKLWVEVHGF